MENEEILSETPKTKVSIVVPTKNEAKHIKDLLDSMVENDIINPSTEVIIVDGHSTDGTVDIASRYSVKIVVESTRTRGGASNVGWKNASGDIVVYTDADCVTVENWIEKMLKHFEDEKVAVVGGADLTFPSTKSYFGKASGLLDELRIAPSHKQDAIFRLRGCNIAYRRSALVESGGFDRALHVGEETELHYRLYTMGYRLIFDPSIIVYHKRRSSITKYFKQFFWYGYSKFKLVMKHPSTSFFPEIFLFPFTSIIIIFSAILYLMNQNFFPLFLFSMAIPAAYILYAVHKLVSYVNPKRNLLGAIAALIIRNIALVIGFFAAVVAEPLKKIGGRKNK